MSTLLRLTVAAAMLIAASAVTQTPASNHSPEGVAINPKDPPPEPTKG